jgi:hypothetical protein
LTGLSGVDAADAAEYAYTEFTSSITVSATTEATAQTLVTLPAVTFSGSTACIVEFHAGDVVCVAVGSGTNRVNFCLFEDGNSLGIVGIVGVDSINMQVRTPVLVKRRRTPSAGAHTYSLRAFATTSGAVNVNVGGSGLKAPGYARITGVGSGIPKPVVNGQWLKGVGGAAVWSAIAAADLPAHSGTEIGYDQTTTNVTVASTTEASPTVLVQGGLYTFDGGPVVAEFFCGKFVLNSTGGANLNIGLYENTGAVTQICRWWGSYNPAAQVYQTAPHLRLRFTPSAGQHKYMAGSHYLTDTGTFTATSGGPGLYPPMFLRFVKA